MRRLLLQAGLYLARLVISDLVRKRQRPEVEQEVAEAKDLLKQVKAAIEPKQA